MINFPCSFISFLVNSFLLSCFLSFFFLHYFLCSYLSSLFIMPSLFPSSYSLENPPYPSFHPLPPFLLLTSPPNFSPSSLILLRFHTSLHLRLLSLYLPLSLSFLPLLRPPPPSLSLSLSWWMQMALIGLWLDRGPSQKQNSKWTRWMFILNMVTPVYISWRCNDLHNNPTVRLVRLQFLQMVYE